MRGENEQAHDGEVVEEKQRSGPLKIKKDIGGCQEQIGRDLVVHKGVQPIGCSRRAGGAERIPHRPGTDRPCRAPEHTQHHIPVQAQVQRHQHKAPEDGQDMQRPRERGAAGNRQEGKHLTRQDHGAYHTAEHGGHKQDVDGKLEHAVRGCRSRRRLPNHLRLST